ncbi:elongation factor G [Allorhizocola rhizosphaerae]|uniref:GTP-binding protein n=1 Tax=Allorhizocola rhizosphaerae TaxID=1872709 RepID=UPI0014790FFA
MRRTLNLGILAHVDAGKTTLTERLLYEAGVIDEVGSVDAGTTQTDSMELERRRGITIRSAVASFVVDGVQVNLIDTPGHPDFIAEVERVLNVLDGAVLVISAVEGVQPQTRVLMRALQRLGVPTLLFVNKLDRAGADPERVLREIPRRLAVRAVRPTARDPLIDVLTANDDTLLAAYVQSSVSAGRLREALAAQTKRALVHPVFFGSAVTGAGVDSLMAGLVELLPTDAGDADGPVAGRIFKVERGVAYLRLFSGTLRVRDRLPQGRVTAIEPGSCLRAGEIGKVWGLSRGRVGDTIGAVEAGVEHHFPPPTLETVVAPKRPQDKGALRAALAQLAEQDPLINVRQDDSRQEIYVSLYGEVQKEVIESLLAADYGLDVVFHETTLLHVERPIGTGEAVERINMESNPFSATVGLRIEPAPVGTGLAFRGSVEARTVPMYAYKNLDGFLQAMRQYAEQALQEGLFGWQVTDCLVTLTECNYSSADGPPSTRGPLSTPGDYRGLTPIVLMQALRQAGTVVCEPMLLVRLEIPATATGGIMTALGRLGAAVRAQSTHGDLTTLEALLPAAKVRDLQRKLPGLTGGEGVLESSFGGYRAVSGDPPRRD